MFGWVCESLRQFSEFEAEFGWVYDYFCVVPDSVLGLELGSESGSVLSV
jgi:hypothetical protein